MSSQGHDAAPEKERKRHDAAPFEFQGTALFSRVVLHALTHIHHTAAYIASYLELNICCTRNIVRGFLFMSTW